MICSSHYLSPDKSCFFGQKDSQVIACLRIFVFTLEGEIIQCIYFYMLVFIMLNLTPFYVEKRIS